VTIDSWPKGLSNNKTHPRTRKYQYQVPGTEYISHYTIECSCMTMKLFFLLYSALLTAWIDAASFPVIYCVNEGETAGQCSTEAILALESTKDWFDAYSAKHAELKKERRQLLDCSRFCNINVTYFSIHYPCECTNNRRLTLINTVSDSSRSLEYNPLLGPIQLFKSFASRLPESHCKTLLDKSRCLVTFVEKYDFVTSLAPDDDDENGVDVDSGDVLSESYNPKTGKYEVYDPSTGEVVPPDNDDGDSGNGDKAEAGAVDLVYDPVTEKYRPVDPTTGEYIDDVGDTSDGNSNTDQTEFVDEIYDPVTGQIHKVDPTTGEYIDEVKDYEEVYDPATGEYHQIDPTTGEYVNP
jgi:hypothetical protein